MDTDTRKIRLRQTFDAAAEGYDHAALRFFVTAAEALADAMALHGDERILDVASGTGNVALACAARLPNGAVTGIDLSEGMLDKARGKAAARGFSQVRFVAADLDTLALDDEPFDGACSGFGLFFMADMNAALERIVAHVRPGGAVGITSFTGEVMEPLSTLFLDRIQRHGVEVPPPSWKRLDSPEKLNALYASAGLGTPEIRCLDVGYPLSGFDAWWDIVQFTGFRGMLDQLAGAERQKFKDAHRVEIDALAIDGVIPIRIDILVTVGQTASAGSVAR